MKSADIFTELYDSVFYEVSGADFNCNPAIMFCVCPRSTLAATILDIMRYQLANLHNDNDEKGTGAKMRSLYTINCDMKRTYTMCIHKRTEASLRYYNIDTYDPALTNDETCYAGDHDAILLQIGSKTEYRCCEWLFNHYMTTYFNKHPVYGNANVIVTGRFNFHTFWNESSFVSARSLLQNYYIQNGLVYLDVFLECNNNLRAHASAAEQNIVRYFYDRMGKGHKMFTRYLSTQSPLDIQDATTAPTALLPTTGSVSGDDDDNNSDNGDDDDDVDDSFSVTTDTTTTENRQYRRRVVGNKGDESACLFDELYWRDKKAQIIVLDKTIYKDVYLRECTLDWEMEYVASFPFSEFRRTTLDFMATVSCEMINIDDTKNKLYLSFSEQLAGTFNRIPLVGLYDKRLWTTIVHRGCIFALGVSRKLSADTDFKVREDNRRHGRHRAVAGLSPGAGVSAFKGPTHRNGVFQPTVGLSATPLSGQLAPATTSSNNDSTHTPVDNIATPSTSSSSSGAASTSTNGRVPFCGGTKYDTCLIRFDHKWPVFRALKHSFIRNKIKSTSMKRNPGRSPRQLRPDSLGTVCNMFTGVITGAGRRFMFTENTRVSFGFDAKTMALVLKQLVSLVSHASHTGAVNNNDDHHVEDGVVVVKLIFNDKYVYKCRVRLYNDDDDGRGEKEGPHRLAGWFYANLWLPIKRLYPYVELYVLENVYVPRQYFIVAYTHNGIAMMNVPVEHLPKLLFGDTHFAIATQTIAVSRCAAVFNDVDTDNNFNINLSRRELESFIAATWKLFLNNTITVLGQEARGYMDSFFGFHKLGSQTQQQQQLPLYKRRPEDYINQLRRDRSTARSHLTTYTNDILLQWTSRYMGTWPKSALANTVAVNLNYSNQKKVNCGMNGLKTTIVSSRYIDVSRLVNTNITFVTQPLTETRRGIDYETNLDIRFKSALVTGSLPDFQRENAYVLKTGLAAFGMLNVADAIIINSRLNLNVIVMYKIMANITVSIKMTSVVGNRTLDELVRRHVHVRLPQRVESRTFAAAQTNHIPLVCTTMAATDGTRENIYVPICEVFCSYPGLEIRVDAYPKYIVDCFDSGKRYMLYRLYNDTYLIDPMRGGQNANVLQHDVSTTVDKGDHSLSSPPRSVTYKITMEFYTLTDFAPKASNIWGMKGMVVARDLSAYFERPEDEPDIVFNTTNIISRHCSGLYHTMRQNFGRVVKMTNGQSLLIGFAPLMPMGVFLRGSAAPMKLDIQTQNSILAAQMPRLYTAIRADDIDNPRGRALPPNASRVLSLYPCADADIRLQIKQGRPVDQSVPGEGGDERETKNSLMTYGTQTDLKIFEDIEQEYKTILSLKRSRATAQRIGNRASAKKPRV